MTLKDKIDLQITSYCLEGKNLKENEAVIDMNKIPLLSEQILFIVLSDIIKDSDLNDFIRLLNSLVNIQPLAGGI